MEKSPGLTLFLQVIEKLMNPFNYKKKKRKKKEKIECKREYAPTLFKSAG